MILKVWNQLCCAYYGDNSYGGDVAEIYFYLLQARSPAYEAHLYVVAADYTTMREWRESDTRTARAFKDLFVLFERQWDCKLSIEKGEASVPVREWEPEPFHRLHVKVDHDLSDRQEARIKGFLAKYE